MTGKRSRRARLRFPCIPGERIVMRMMVKALLFDSAGEIEKLQALQIDWAGCGVSELCATSDFAEAYRLTMENKVHIIFCNYIQNEKIKTAIYLFKETNLSVSQVADRLGYTNFSYFSQLFKQKTGYTVREYKRKYLNKTDGDNAADLLR